MRFLKSEAGAIILWLAASLFVAALLTPHLYDAGKQLAESAKSKEYPAAVEYLAASAERAKPDRYFSRSLTISALALLPFLIRRVKSLPRGPRDDVYALRKSTWCQRLTHLASGLLFGMAALGALAIFLELSNSVVPRQSDVTIMKFFSKAFAPAVGAGVIEELLFRGLLLGLWLRTCSVRTACISSSVMFSFAHFLSPPNGIFIEDARAWHAGFDILFSTLGHFANPRFFVTDFTMLILLGLLLSWCRIHSYSLWLPIGLHTGLVFAVKALSMVRVMNNDSPLSPWLVGNDLKSGLLPIIALGICFVCCKFYLRMFPPTEMQTTAPTQA